MEGNITLAYLIFLPFICAVISFLIGKRSKVIRDYFAVIAVICEFILMLWQVISYLQDGTLLEQSIGFVNYSGRKSYIKYNAEQLLVIKNVCGMGLTFALDGFRGLYGLIICGMWMMTMLFSREYFMHYRNRNRYYLFNLMTLGATMGVFLSADLYTTFIFFEIMSFTSYVWVAQDERKESLQAAETYLAVAIIGGLVLLMGLFLLYNAVGTLSMNELPAACKEYPDKVRLMAAGVCMLVGFGAKAGVFPLHIWLPKAHPVAPAPASALLSGVLTKSGIFGILVITCNIFPEDTGWGKLLLVLGLLTMFGGAVLAVLSVDLKRTLACSSMSQIGFIVVGIAMQCMLEEETAAAVRGTLLHMVNHSLIKLVLFMAAGVVFMNLHELDLNEIRGFGRKKPLLNFAFLMGALGIGGIPLWNGYVSKTLLHESLVEFGSPLAEWIFLISGGLTAAYMAKLYIALFIEKNADAKKQKKFDENKHYMNLQSSFALAASAVLLPILGMLPNVLTDKLADMGQGFMKLYEAGGQVSYFSLENLKGAVISITIGAVVYVVIVRKLLMKKQANGVIVYMNRLPVWMDLENILYRPVLTGILPFVLGWLCRILDGIWYQVTVVSVFISGVLCRICDSFVDGIIVLLRKTVYRDSALPHELVEGNKVTYAFGSFMDGIVKILNRTVCKKKPITTSFVKRFAMWHEDVSENNTIIGRSMSFGLLLFGLGLFATVGYLLIFGR